MLSGPACYARMGWSDMKQAPSYWPHQLAIRDYTPDDAAALYVLSSALEPAAAGSLTEWAGHLNALSDLGGRAWVAASGSRLAGYALVVPLPGLPGLFDLNGSVAPDQRRRGIGTRLLEHVCEAAHPLGAEMLSALANDPDGPMASFLLRRGFFVEHEEILLERKDLWELPVLPELGGAEVVSLPREQAVDTFCRLYRQSFDGLPWSQPYTRVEVAAELVSADDLLFLVRDGQAIGVAWLAVTPGGVGQIEPIGIARDHQRRGNGRLLLIHALHRLWERGALRAEIGAWRDNAAAILLYETLGFVEIDSWAYLARDLR